jgi:hypothetical protein
VANNFSFSITRLTQPNSGIAILADSANGAYFGAYD